MIKFIKGKGGNFLSFKVALLGNPNTGKTTLFNVLTGLNQHTGNWAGKTVLKSVGSYVYEGQKYEVIDLPGTYSVVSSSAEEEVARNYLCFANPEVVVVVVDATNLERNLNLVLQLLEIKSNIIVCVNLLDEAERKKIKIRLDLLEEELGVPVVGISARKKEGISNLLEDISNVAKGEVKTNPYLVKYNLEIEEKIKLLEGRLKAFIPPMINNRWLALRLLEGDEEVIFSLEESLNKNINKEVLS